MYKDISQYVWPRESPPLIHSPTTPVSSFLSSPLRVYLPFPLTSLRLFPSRQHLRSHLSTSFFCTPFPRVSLTLRTYKSSYLFFSFRLIFRQVASKLIPPSLERFPCLSRDVLRSPYRCEREGSVSFFVPVALGGTLLYFTVFLSRIFLYFWASLSLLPRIGIVLFSYVFFL